MRERWITRTWGGSRAWRIGSAAFGDLRSAALIVIAWEGADAPLCVKYLREGERAFIGDVAGALARLPLAIGAGAPETGAPAPIAEVTPAGVIAHIPEGHAAERTSAPRPAPRSATAPRAVSRLGAGPTTLDVGDIVAMRIGAFVVSIEAIDALDPLDPRELPSHDPLEIRPNRARGGVWTHAALAGALHLGAVFFAARAASAHALTETTEPAPIARYLAAAEARAAAEETPAPTTEAGEGKGAVTSNKPGDGKADGGQKAGQTREKEGKMGSAASRESARRYAVSGASTPDLAAMSREEAIASARAFGMIGLLRSGVAESHAVSFGDAFARGPDPFAARGDLWASAIGDTFGSGGLGLTGTGISGGGGGLGIGLGSVGTFGHGNGFAGLGSGGNGSPLWDNSWDSSWGGHYVYCGTPREIRRPPGPRMSIGGVSLVHALNADPQDEEAMQAAADRGARDAYATLIACYKSGLETNPAAKGAVQMRVLFGADGRVLVARGAPSGTIDAETARCASQAYAKASFDRPDGGATGTRTATFSIVFRTTR